MFWRIERWLAVMLSGLMVVYVLTIIVKLNPSLSARTYYYAAYLRWWAWYTALPTWKREALKVRGWIT